MRKSQAVLHCCLLKFLRGFATLPPFFRSFYSLFAHFLRKLRHYSITSAHTCAHVCACWQMCTYMCMHMCSFVPVDIRIYCSAMSMHIHGYLHSAFSDRAVYKIWSVHYISKCLNRFIHILQGGVWDIRNACF